MYAFEDGQYIIPFDNVLYVKVWDDGMGFTIRTIKNNKITMDDIKKVENYIKWLKLKSNAKVTIPM